MLVRLVNERFTQEWQNRGSWVAQSVDLGEGLDLNMVGSSPMLGPILSIEPTFKKKIVHNTYFKKIRTQITMKVFEKI